MSVIAAHLGNNEAICAKHYAHLSPGYVSDKIRANFKRIEPEAKTATGKVVEIGASPSPEHARKAATGRK